MIELLQLKINKYFFFSAQVDLTYFQLTRKSFSLPYKLLPPQNEVVMPEKETVSLLSQKHKKLHPFFSGVLIL